MLALSICVLLFEIAFRRIKHINISFYRKILSFSTIIKGKDEIVLFEKYQTFKHVISNIVVIAHEEFVSIDRGNADCEMHIQLDLQIYHVNDRSFILNQFDIFKINENM
jgi:hypothetical protein